MGMDDSGPPNHMGQDLLDPQQVDDAVDSVCSYTGSSLPRRGELASCLGDLDTVAENQGLGANHLHRIISFISVSKIQATFARRLLGVLVPRDQINGKDLATLIFWTFRNGLSIDLCVLPALRVVGLCLQYGCILDVGSLIQIYELLTGWLNNKKVFKVVIEILNLITDRAEVTPWRAKLLTKIHSRNEPNSHLDQIICKFKSSRPELVSCRPKSKSKESPSSTVITRRFHKVFQRKFDKELETHNLWSGGSIFSSNVQYQKSRRVNLIPSRECLPLPVQKSVKRLTDCNSTEEILDNIHRLQLPSNILSLLYCQKSLYIFASDRELVERLSLSLYHTLRQEFLCDKVSKIDERILTRQRTLLRLVADLQDCLSQGLPVIGRFLAEYLSEHWDGCTHLREVLRLVSKLQLTECDELEDCILAPLCRHLPRYSVSLRLAVLESLHALLRHWAGLELERFQSWRTDTVVPLNTNNVCSPLEGLSMLSGYLGHTQELCLYLGADGGRADRVEQDLVTSLSLNLNLTSQRLLVSLGLPVKLPLPPHLIYSSLTARHPAHLEIASKILLQDRRDVLPLLKNAPCASSSAEHSLLMEPLLPSSLTKAKTLLLDLLVVLSPSRVELTPHSIFKQPWVTRGDMDETWLTDSLFISSHVAFLPEVFRYLDQLSLPPEDLPAAFSQLSVEGWDSLEASHSPLSSFLNLVAPTFPSIIALIQEFQPPSSQRGPALSKHVEDRRSTSSSLRTGDSGFHENKGRKQMPPPALPKSIREVSHVSTPEQGHVSTPEQGKKRVRSRGDNNSASRERQSERGPRTTRSRK